MAAITSWGEIILSDGSSSPIHLGNMSSFLKAYLLAPLSGALEEEGRRVKLGHCASLLAPSGILNELVALRRWLTPGPNTTVKRFTQSVVPLYCT